MVYIPEYEISALLIQKRIAGHNVSFRSRRGYVKNIVAVIDAPRIFQNDFRRAGNIQSEIPFVRQIFRPAHNDFVLPVRLKERRPGKFAPVVFANLLKNGV